MQTFFVIDSSCVDFMHTNSVLCRLFADLVHTLRRVHCSAAARPAGADRLFLRGLRSRGGSAIAAGSYAYLGEAEVVGAGAALLDEVAGPPPAAALPGEAGSISGNVNRHRAWATGWSSERTLPSAGAPNTFHLSS